MTGKFYFLFIVIIISILCFNLAFGEHLIGSGTRPERSYARAVAAQDGIPNTQEKFHCAGELYLTISNWGFFGSQRGDDNPYYCIVAYNNWGSCDWTSGTCLPSAEYPGGSGIEYLFQGALWIGAVVEGDTFVSIGEDGWITGWNQLFPGADLTSEQDSIVERSSFDDSNAVSQQDFIAVFSDTVMNSAYVPPEHRPMGLKVKQSSYAWGYDYAKNFVFIDYTFENIRPEYYGDSATLEDMYIGIYLDGDVGHIDTPDYAQDDITGFLRYFVDPYTGDTTEVNVAWLADNEGDTKLGRFSRDTSPTGAMGLMVLQTPNPDIETSYNWWISNIDETYDWGPDRRPFEPFDGTPEGLTNKYIIMSNGEFDYDQTEIMDSSESGMWLPPPPEVGPNLQNGYDTRFLLSFGPLNVPVAESVKVVIAFMVAEDFHTDPSNSADDPDRDKYNLTNLAYTANWCKLVFENGYKGPQPPDPPSVRYTTSNNSVTLYWPKCKTYNTGDGEVTEYSETEEEIDPITLLKDFEGYRIWVAEANLESYYTMLISWDKIDYKARYSNGAWIDTLAPIWGIDSFRVPGTALDSTYVRDKYGFNFWPPPETTYNVAGTTFIDYMYRVEHLLAGRDLYFVVTAFDFGQISKDLNSLESNKRNNALHIVPKGEAAASKKVTVVPNPYRIDTRYPIEEDPTRTWTEYSRKIRFLNLPKKSTIRIFTVDGDLVRKLQHDYDDSGLDTEDWDLISRNDQAVVSGIYIFVVTEEDTGESQEGTFVIIK
ncbi:hypothetical protein JXI42_14280 [bacterium]|nr:hypothetical protein [bacterium]